MREESQGSANAPLLEQLNTLLSDEPDRPSQAEITREFGMTENPLSQHAPPAGITYGDLKLMPWWDSLRGDPRFEKIVASLAPK
ncbi:MAG TPA: hypothetical protein VFH87_13955 [Candidatus Udaeobacter sp.]|nr:hypothetical protein [Candidatus Udaeobacter sp.]